MPDIVLSRHGRYVFAQSGSGWEVREIFDAHRRIRWAIGGVLLGAAGVLWAHGRHPFALPLALIGAGLVIAGLKKKGRCLAVRDAEIAWGYTGDMPVQTAAWPRSRIALVVLERGSRLTEPKFRRRVPDWSVSIRAREGDTHPARFTFSVEAPARALAETLARKLSVEIAVVDASIAGTDAITRSHPTADPLRSGGMEPRPGRLDPR